MEFLILILLIFVYYSFKYAWWGKSVDYSNPRILMYHMVSEHKDNANFNSLRVKPAEFEKQIKYLAENNWNFFTMSELIEKKDQLPSKSIAITFDDGYEDNYVNAYPILKKYDVKATIYLVVDRHHREWSSKRKNKNSDGELKFEPKLKNEQIKEMLKSRLIEIGSHTITHDNLIKLDLGEKIDEISNSKILIENEFNIKCNSFCYPFGLYDKNDIKIVKDSGYTNATTTIKGIDNLKNSNNFELKRITVSGKDNLLAFKIKIKRGLKGVSK